jgi:uncharacterized protein (DUF2267 family)
MSATGLEVFDKSLQITNTWLSEIMGQLGTDRHVAWHVLGTVLRIVRDRVPLGLAAHLGAQLPLIIRGAYYDQWQPSQEPKKWRTAEEFLVLIVAGLRDIEPVPPAEAAEAVFQVLNHFVDPGQVQNIKDAMPSEVKDLWPDSGPPRGMSPAA